MLSILPNYHPIVVHYTVALVTLALVGYGLGVKRQHTVIGQELLVVGRWCLWLGTLAALITVIAGFHAYYTVAHDGPSHAKMIIHRNWALVTFVVVMLAAGWSIIMYRRNSQPTTSFLFLLLVAFSLMLVTAWYGGELVYRHGLGVMDLPDAHNGSDGHDHGSTTSLSAQGIQKTAGESAHHDSHATSHHGTQGRMVEQSMDQPVSRQDKAEQGNSQGKQADDGHPQRPTNHDHSSHAH